MCISTVSLWLLLVYTEASLRLKDLKTSYANLSHLFAAHWYIYRHVYVLKALRQFSNSTPPPPLLLLQHRIPGGLPGLVRHLLFHQHLQAADPEGGAERQ